MNSIENEQIKFYFQHEARIREWAGLETEVIKFVDRFYRSLKGDLDALLISGRIADDGVESFLVEGNWPGLCLRRRTWPVGDDRVYVEMEWYLRWSRFFGQVVKVDSRTEQEAPRWPGRDDGSRRSSRRG